MRPLPPLAIFTAFAIGLEAIVGLSLGLSDGLSETHKSVLVAFIVAFPALTLFLFVNLLPRAERAETTAFRSRKAELVPEPYSAKR
jgi:hypothetical protein